MKRFRIICIALFLVITVGFGIYVVYKNEKRNRYAPVIAFEQEQIEVTIDAEEDALLQGVTAKDEEDGDVTDSLLVEGINTMVEPGVCIVTYAAFDSENLVTKASRKVKYTDYTSPKFSISQPCTTESWAVTRISKYVTAIDCIEGDIGAKIKVNKIESNEDESYRSCEFQVTNSLGDTSYLTVRFEFQTLEDQQDTPHIQLKDYVCYLKKGENLEYKSYLKGLVDDQDIYGFDYEGNISDGEFMINKQALLPADSVQIESNIDNTTPGTYKVTYSYSMEDGRVAKAELLTVVEE